MREDQPPANDPAWGRGVIIQFLRRNLFKVRLKDGQEVVAAMPSNLLHLAANFRHGLKTPFISVQVEFRKPPRIHRIVEARESGLTGYSP